MLAKNFKKYFITDEDILISYEWVRHPYQNLKNKLKILNKTTWCKTIRDDGFVDRNRLQK